MSARGSKFAVEPGGAHFCLRLELVEHGVEPPVGRHHRGVPDRGVEGVVVGDDLEREVEAAGLDELDQRVDARGDEALFPAGDDGAVAPGAFGQLRLREPCAEPGFADDPRASHRQKYRTNRTH